MTSIKLLIVYSYIITVDDLVLNELALLIVLDPLILEYPFTLVYPFFLKLG